MEPQDLQVWFLAVLFTNQSASGFNCIHKVFTAAAGAHTHHMKPVQDLIDEQ